jgi:hypothetical protein
MTVRQARMLTALDGLTDGDHVSWLVEQPAQFAQMTAHYLREGAVAGQKLFFFGPQRDDQPQSLPVAEGVSVLDPHTAFMHGGTWDPAAMYEGLGLERSKALAEGYRGLRVMADMDWLLAAHPSGDRIAAFEQGLDTLVAQTGVTVVCAYRRENFSPGELAGVMCVHPHQLGEVPRDLGFRIWNSGEGRWHIAGDVDVRAAEAFPAALRRAADGRTRLWLDCTELRFIDVAGIRALGQVAYSTGISMQLHGAGETVQHFWKMLDWDSAEARLEFCA